LTISKIPGGQAPSSSASTPGFAPGSAAGAAAEVSSAPATQAASSSDESFASETNRAIEQSEALSRSALLKKGKNGQFSDSLFALSIHRNGYFTAEFLEKIGFLWFNKDEKGLISPGFAAIEKKETGGIVNRNDPETFQQFENIILSPFSSTPPLHVGDTVSILHSDQFVKFGARTANLVRRTARARITEVKRAPQPKVTAQLFKEWDMVQSGDRVDTLARFSDLAIDTIAEGPMTTIKGTIFLRVENTERPYLYHTFILDRGSKDGVELGDMFAVISGRVPAAGHTVAVACAVNIGETSSTLSIEKLFDNNVAPGDTAVIIKRIHFKK
jgi:hypothetical protein